MADSDADMPAAEPVVILRVGAAGGDVTLYGKKAPDGTWWFKRATVDQTEFLLGDADSIWRSESGWVDGWEAALQQLDRYPWARLHPLEVYPEFRDLVRAEVEVRLSKTPPSRQTERVKARWEELLRRDQSGS